MIIKGLTEDDKPNFTTHLVYTTSSSNFRFNQHSIKLDINNFVLNNFSYLYFPIILKKSKFYYTSELYTSIKHTSQYRNAFQTNLSKRIHPKLDFTPPFPLPRNFLMKIIPLILVDRHDERAVKKKGQRPWRVQIVEYIREKEGEGRVGKLYRGNYQVVVQRRL